MKKTLFLLIIVISAFIANAQIVTDTIQIEKRHGTVFVQNGTPLSPAKLSQLARPYPLAYTEMKKAQGNLFAGTFFSYLGGFLIGYPIGTAIGGGDPEWTMAAIGAGCIAIAIPFSSGYNRRAKNAVRIINGELKQVPVSQSEMKFGTTSNGVGLTLKF